MALSLSPPQLKQAINISPLPNIPPQPCSTPRQFTAVVHGNRHDHETLSTGMSQTESPPLNSGFDHVIHDDDMHKLTPPSHVLPDLPSWTPLRTQEDAEGSSTSDPEIDELAIRKLTDLPTKPLVRRPTNTRATVEITVTAGRTPKSSSDAKPPKAKKARFDGVVIATKSPPYRKRFAGAQARHGRAPARTLSLVDALARTFDANRHTEDDFRRQSRPVSRQHDNVPTGPQTDVETTEAEDEQLQLNTRLAHAPLKRRRLGPRVTRAVSANVSEPNSEDAVPFRQDVPPLERPVKRLKAIQYEANPALIDAALGTVQAPISWDAEMDIITREEEFTPPQTTHAQAPSVEVRMAVDKGDPTASSSSVPASAQIPAGNPCLLLTRSGLIRTAPVLSPYQSRSAKFRERLDAIFGENTTVRTDRSVKPRPADLDFFATLDEFEREPSLSPSKSTVSGSSASTVEEVTSAVPSTHITSQSPDIPSIDTNMCLLPRKQVNEADSPTKPIIVVDEEEIHRWIAALQRLVKGKVRVKEEELETLSIILAEIESVKDGLDQSFPTTSELRESVKQLAKLHEIPFGDRNKLRKRAGNIFLTWPSGGKLAAS